MNEQTPGDQIAARLDRLPDADAMMIEKDLLRGLITERDIWRQRALDVQDERDAAVAACNRLQLELERHIATGCAYVQRERVR